MNYGAGECPMSHASRHTTRSVACTCAVHSSSRSALAAGPDDFRFTSPRAEALPLPPVAAFRACSDSTATLAGYARPRELPPKPLA
jgi:hypothetical protein